LEDFSTGFVIVRLLVTELAAVDEDVLCGGVLERKISVVPALPLPNVAIFAHLHVLELNVAVQLVHLHFDPPAGPLVILMGVVAGDQPCASPFSWAHAASWNR
jgi:hypothetical protein